MLKQIVLNKRKETLATELEQLRTEASDIEKRAAELQKREAELEQAVTEVTAETSEADKAELDAAVAEFENQQSEHEEAARQNADKIAALEQQISELDAELAALNERANVAHINTAEQAEERKEVPTMENRTKFFGMTMQERDAFFGNEEVKGFLQRVRELGAQKRAVTGADLLIPTVMLDLLRERIDLYSKLAGKVNLQRVPGKARQSIMGQIPEAVWTEACATLNELDITFNAVDVDGYKVGGYIAICNALLEDSDPNLATVLLNALGQAIGLALDKAIVYGTGVKMPLGIITRIAQTVRPESLPASEPWVDIHTSNSVTIASSVSGKEVFKKLAAAAGKLKSSYAAGNKIWIMNESTQLSLLAEGIEVNAAGAYVSGAQGTMPIIGGEFVIVSDRVMPNGTVVVGYGENYLLAERAGTALAQSEHVRFIEDQTVFKGTARYDGKPVVAGAFVVIGIGGAPTTSATFATDTANAANAG